jgi:hypothetical protein
MSVVINGVIGMIPIVDQVLDIRDVSANVLACNKKGWGNLGEEEYANLAFAAIGLIPTAGSFFKGAVKPLWKERKVAGRGVQAGIAMMERALGMGKGGVVKWVRALNWAEQTQAAVAKAQAAMGVYISLLMTIRADPWWATRDMVVTASRLLPGARDAQWYLADTIKKGSKLVETFLNDLLGEHAVMVMAAVQVAQANVKTGKAHSPAKAQAAGNKMATEMRGGGGKSGAAAASTTATPTKEKPLDAKHPEVGGQAVRKVDQGAGTSKITMEKRRKDIENFAKARLTRQVGLIAEHMVDYHVLKAYSGVHPHGSTAAQAPKGRLVKVNSFKRPVELEPEDLCELTTSGIDSLWLRSDDGKYLVVETKGRTYPESRSPTETKNDTSKRNSKMESAKRNGRGWNEAPEIPASANLTKHQAQLWRMLNDNYDKSGAQTGMQMSRDWVEKDILKTTLKKVKPTDYERQVYLAAAELTQFAPVAPGYAQHLVAFPSVGAAIMARPEGSTQDHSKDHDQHKDPHGISWKYGEKDVEAVEKLRDKNQVNQGKQPTSETDKVSKQRSKKAN